MQRIGKKCMTASRPIVRIVLFVLLAVFLTCILTVESHANEPGSLNSRCPTCVDNNVHFAIDAQHNPALGLPRITEYLQLPERALGFSSSVISLNDYRAPPASR